MTLEETGGTGADLSNSVIRSVKGVETNLNTINQHLTCKAPCPFDECSGGPRLAHAALGDGSAQRDQRHQSLPDGNYSKIERYGFPSLAILWVQDRFLASAKFRRLTVRDQLAQANWGVRGVVKRDRMAEGSISCCAPGLSLRAQKTLMGPDGLTYTGFLYFLDTPFNRYDTPTCTR